MIWSRNLKQAFVLRPSCC